MDGSLIIMGKVMETKFGWSPFLISQFCLAYAYFVIPEMPTVFFNGCESLHTIFQCERYRKNILT